MDPKTTDWMQLMDTFQASLEAQDQPIERWREPETRQYERERSLDFARDKRVEPEEPEESVWMILARQASLDQKLSSSRPVATAAPVVQNPEVLKPGNYLLVMWDALFWVEDETQVTHICQISASVPQGEDFRYSLLHADAA